MQKVNWKAKFDYEFIGNFKVFQNTLEKLGIVRKIEVKDYVILDWKASKS